MVLALGPAALEEADDGVPCVAEEYGEDGEQRDGSEQDNGLPFGSLGELSGPDAACRKGGTYDERRSLTILVH